MDTRNVPIVYYSTMQHYAKQEASSFFWEKNITELQEVVLIALDKNAILEMCQ